MSDRRFCLWDGKVCYGGPNEAKRAHAAAHYRIRAYWCEQGRTWHVTNGEKRHRQSRRFDAGGERSWGKSRR